MTLTPKNKDSKKPAGLAGLNPEDIFKFTLAHSVDALFWMGPDARFVYVNNTACEMLGYTRDELLGMTVHDIDPDFPAQAWPQHWDVLKEKKSMIIESHHRKKSGEVFPVEIAINYIELDGNEYNCAFARDITDRKKTEDALKIARDFAQKYLDVAGVMLVGINADQNVFLINKKGTDILGYPEHEIIGAKWFDTFLPQDNIEAVKGVFDKLMAGEAEPVEYFENNVVNKQGEKRLIKWHNSLITDDSGEITGTLSSGEDITDQKSTEAALQKSEKRYYDLFEQMPDGLYRSTPEGRFIAINSAFVKMLGYRSKEEVLSLYIPRDVYFSPEDRQAVNEPLVEKEGPDTTMIRLKKKDGSEIWVEDHGHAVCDKNGNTLYYEGVLRDTSDRLKAQEVIRAK